MVAVVPPVTPVTRPDEGSTEALAGALLAHEPPGDVELNSVVAPGQTLKTPVIGLGAARKVSDVTIVVAEEAPHFTVCR